jgi:hypothetical protein
MAIETKTKIMTLFLLLLISREEYGNMIFKKIKLKRFYFSTNGNTNRISAILLPMFIVKFSERAASKG